MEPQQRDVALQATTINPEFKTKATYCLILIPGVRQHVVSNGVQIFQYTAAGEQFSGKRLLQTSKQTQNQT